MSIFLIIDNLEKIGKKLIPYPPTVPVKTRSRHISMTPNTHKWCLPSGAHPDSRISDHCLSQLHEVLNAFVRGDEMENRIDIKRLHPSGSEVWEFRSYVHKPYLRVFGCFYLPNHFLAVHQANRDDLEKKSGPKWDRAIAKAISERDKFLSGKLPFSGNSFRKYVY